MINIVVSKTCYNSAASSQLFVHKPSYYLFTPNNITAFWSTTTLAVTLDWLCHQYDIYISFNQILPSKTFFQLDFFQSKNDLISPHWEWFSMKCNLDELTNTVSWNINTRLTRSFDWHATYLSPMSWLLWYLLLLYDDRWLCLQDVVRSSPCEQTHPPPHSSWI